MLPSLSQVTDKLHWLSVMVETMLPSLSQVTGKLHQIKLYQVNIATDSNKTHQIIGDR